MAPNSGPTSTEPIGIDTRIDRLNALREEHDAPEVWLARPTNFAWLAGGDSIVDRTSPLGVAAVGFDGDRFRVLTANNERDRIRTEELSRLPTDRLDVTAFPWHETSVPEAIAVESAPDAVADAAISGLDRVDVTSLHVPLTDAELAAYREDGRAAARAVETVAREVTPETTEREATAALFAELVECGFEVPVALVGGSDRGVEHRHFTPKDEPLDRFGHLTVVAARAGRNVAVTRTVAFDPPAWLEDRHAAASRVAASAMAETRRVGRGDGTAGDVFATIEEAYDAVGYPDEWREHHQGGPIGYETREWIATPESDRSVPIPMAYAWNPTVQGAKTEDTVLVTADGIDVVTETGEWPTTEYEAAVGDGELVTHDVLVRDGQ